MSKLVAFVLVVLFAVAQSEEELKIEITQEVEDCKIAAENGDTCHVHYKGSLLDGTKFDASYDRGQPYVFQLGMGQVIQGYEQVILQFSGMLFYNTILLGYSWNV